MAKFDDLIDYSLAWEGGYSDHPDDKGGATNYGITIGRLSDYRGYEVTKDEVKSLSKDEAIQIFRSEYWNKIQGDQIEDPGVALFVHDMAINHGPARAARYLQSCVGAVVDSAIGPETLGKANACDPHQLVKDLAQKRHALYEGIVENNPSQGAFLKGWMNRHESILDTAKSLAGTATPVAAPKPAPKPKPAGKDPMLDGMMKGKKTITAAGVATVAASVSPLIPGDSEVMLAVMDRLMIVAVALVILFGFIKWLRIWRDKHA